MTTTKSILCVDDDPSVLRSLTRLLRKEDFGVLTATSGAEALGMLSEYPMQVILSDQRMPGMTGTDLMVKIRRIRPDLVRLVLSGYSDAGTILDSINKGEIYRFSPKPWDDDELKVVIRACFSHYEKDRTDRRYVEEIERKIEGLQIERDRLAQEVSRSRELLNLSMSGLEAFEKPFLCITGEGKIVLANEAARHMFEPDHPIVGTGLEHMLPPSQARDVIDVCSSLATTGNPGALSIGGRRIHVLHVSRQSDRGPVHFALSFEPKSTSKPCQG